MGAAAPDWMQERLRAADEDRRARGRAQGGRGAGHRALRRPDRSRRAGPALLHLQHLQRDPGDLRLAWVSGSASNLDRPFFLELGNLLPAEARLEQDLLGVLTQLGRHAHHAGRCVPLNRTGRLRRHVSRTALREVAVLSGGPGPRLPRRSPHGHVPDVRASRTPVGAIRPVVRAENGLIEQREQDRLVVVEVVGLVELLGHLRSANASKNLVLSAPTTPTMAMCPSAVVRPMS